MLYQHLNHVKHHQLIQGIFEIMICEAHWSGPSVECPHCRIELQELKIKEYEKRIQNLEMDYNRLELKAEDVDCLHMVLDDMEIPRAAAKWGERELNTYSLVGRTELAIKKARGGESATEEALRFANRVLMDRIKILEKHG